MEKISMLSPLYLDLVFSGLPRIPDYGEEVFASRFDLQLGGGALAPAIILNRLQLEVNLGTFLNQGYLSQIARSLLAKENINYTNLYQGEEEPVVLTAIMSFSHDRSMVSYNPIKLNDYQLGEEDLYRFLRGSKICFVTKGFDQVYRQLCKEGVILVYDLGWEDHLHIKNLAPTLAYTHFFLPNEKEALKMTGAKNANEACKILKDYVKHPIIKLGPKGAITYLENQVVAIPMPMKYEAIDTTGAGDNFMAGLMYGLYQDWDIIKCIQFANVLGGYSTTGMGCYGARPDYPALLQSLDQYPPVVK